MSEALGEVKTQIAAVLYAKTVGRLVAENGEEVAARSSFSLVKFSGRVYLVPKDDALKVWDSEFYDVMWQFMILFSMLKKVNQDAQSLSNPSQQSLAAMLQLRDSIIAAAANAEKFPKNAHLYFAQVGKPQITLDAFIRENKMPLRYFLAQPPRFNLSAPQRLLILCCIKQQLLAEEKGLPAGFVSKDIVNLASEIRFAIASSPDSRNAKPADVAIQSFLKFLRIIFP